MPKPRPVLAGLVAVVVAAGGVGTAAWALPQARVPFELTTQEQLPASSAIPALANTETTASSGSTSSTGPASQTVLRTLERLDQLLPQWDGVILEDQRFVSPVPLRCAVRHPALYQGRTWYAQRPGKPGAVNVSVVVSGPGYGTHVASWLTRQLAACGAALEAGVPGSVKAKVDGIYVTARVIGDAMFVVSGDERIYDETAKVATIANSVLLDELQGVCADTAPSSSQERNPYQGGTFTGLLARVGVSSGGAGSLDLPDPLPSPSVTAPKPRAFPELALPSYEPAPGSSQGTSPTQEESGNEENTAPMLVDPEEVEPPAVEQTTPPEEPEAPVRGNIAHISTVQVPDPVGPGCGWAFLGLEVPTVNPDVAKAQAQQVLEEGAAEAAEDLFEQLLAQANYQQAWERYQQVAYEWAAYEQYEKILELAIRELEDARKAWEDAINELTQPEPTPSPEPSAGPNGEGSPSPRPSGTALPTPSPTPAEPSQTPSPAPSPSSTPSPSEAE